ncbi:retroviral-like aspartic protease family protein [Chitinibacter sp. SCUT-21]|uniref:retropepsin-like aspartic protease family protein n=1 Tax=Chitinibacter sp. SCUT-21 TaxID=2970891 RepID=UPI0035A68A7E
MIKTLAALSLCLSSLTWADDIILIATMGNKGIFQINGQKKTLQAGQQNGQFKVIAIQAESAVVESNGKQRQLQLGQGYTAPGSSNANTSGSLVLTPDERGHYMVDITINQNTQKGVVDTGATHLSMSRTTADMMKLDYKNGQAARSQTANGVIGAWIIKVPQLRLGSITLYDVPTVVRDSNDGSPILIGTSLLNRFQMTRDQSLMILSKKAY